MAGSVAICAELCREKGGCLLDLATRRPSVIVARASGEGRSGDSGAPVDGSRV